MPSLSLDQIRARSTAAFGQSYRIEVMLAIAEADSRHVALSEISKRLHIQMSSVQRPLQSLVEIGLLTRSEDSSTRTKNYIRNESTGWQFAYELSGLKPGKAMDALKRLRPPD